MDGWPAVCTGNIGQIVLRLAENISAKWYCVVLLNAAPRSN
jgi:hypothetical protein